MLVYEGEALSLWELRYEIEQERKMTSNDYDLLFYDAENNERIEDENAKIEKNSRIIVERIPNHGMPTKSVFKRENTQRVPPDNYVCYRCGEKGHFIQFCPRKHEEIYEGPNFGKLAGVPKHLISADNKVAKTNKEWKKQTNSVKYKDVPENLRCTECRGSLENPVMTSCKHNFCEECILPGERCVRCRKTVLYVNKNEELEHLVQNYKESSK